MTGWPQWALVAIWLGFGLAFSARARSTGSSAATTKRSPLALLGIALQGVGFALAWSGVGRRGAAAVPVALATAGLVIGLGSAGLALVAVRHLGKQWALQARLVEGHQLVTTGPYAYVRHPIYTAMLGMLVATGLLTGALMPLAIGLVPFLVGTWIRTQREEALLRGQFGEAFEAYRRRAGWLLPFVG
jgi:protein-S-isoprenylcysteine O-methyltransferase Ste14